MLCPAEPNTFCPKSAGHCGIARDVGVGANSELAGLVSPAHEGCEVAARGVRKLSVRLPENHPPGRAVERNPIAFFERQIANAHLLLSLVHFCGAAAGYAALAHASG